MTSVSDHWQLAVLNCFAMEQVQDGGAGVGSIRRQIACPALVDSPGGATCPHLQQGSSRPALWSVGLAVIIVLNPLKLKSSTQLPVFV